MRTLAAISIVGAVIASQAAQESLDLLLKYAVEFGGAAAGALLMLWPILKRVKHMEDSQTALHDRLDRAGIPMSPGRTVGQPPRRTRSGVFKAVKKRPALSSETQQHVQGPPAEKDK